MEIEDFFEDEECPFCEKHKANILWIKEFLSGAIEAVYETGSVEDLEDSLEELCAIFKCKIPDGKPMLESIKNKEKL